MKKVLFICMMAVLGLTGYAQTEQGTQSVGFDLGYGFDGKNLNLGLDYRYNLTDEIRLAPSLSHFVRNDNLSAWAIDLNAHYVVKLDEMFGFYPLAGLDLSFWKYRVDTHLAPTHTFKYTRFGVNLGLGGELYATDQLTLGIEIKYNIIKDFDQAIIGLRAGYNF